MENTSPKPFVFVLMPFKKDWDDIYHLGIKIACAVAGAYCERVDEQTFLEDILARVYNQIAKADIIVAEMTGRNPNVFYETGYAHALNKQVILLTQNPDDIPFDLKHYPHIVYDGTAPSLIPQLETKVRWCIENPKKSLSYAGLNLDFFINQVQLAAGSITQVPIEVKGGHGFEYNCLLEIDIHNPTYKTVNPDSIQLELRIPHTSFSAFCKDILRYTIRENDSIFNLRIAQPLFPKSQERLDFHIRGLNVTPKHEMSLCLFTELGPIYYPFTKG